LLRLVEEFQKYVLITGFGGVKIENTEDFLKLINIAKSPNVEAQTFNAEGVATWQHLYFAALNALTAFKYKTNISKSLAMETMLYASAQRQIRKATSILGIKPSSRNIAMLMIGERPEDLKLAVSKISEQVNAERDEAVLELTDQKMARIQRIFGISNEELSTVMKGHKGKKALIDLVIERMALLATER
jgi:KEOPS complex subunit Cgi121